MLASLSHAELAVVTAESLAHTTAVPAARPAAPATATATIEAPASDPFALDPAALSRLRELDPSGANQVLARVAKAYLTATTRLRDQLETARRAGDRPALRLVVHTLKSSSAVVGGSHLAGQCAELEPRILREEPGALGAELDAVVVSLDATLLAIDRLLEARA